MRMRVEQQQQSRQVPVRQIQQLADGAPVLAPVDDLVIPPAVPPEAVKPESKPEPKSEPKPAGEDWKDKRLAKLTAQKHELEAALAAKQASGAAPNPTDDLAIAAKIDELAKAKAQAIAATTEFDRKCEAVVSQGRAEFPDFNDKVKTLLQLKEGSEERYGNFIAAMLETDKAASLIHSLADDLNEAEKIMNMSPVKQGIALARLADKVPAPVSELPKPITPIGQKAPSHQAIEPTDTERADNLSTAEWMRRREEQVRARGRR